MRRLRKADGCAGAGASLSEVYECLITAANLRVDRVPGLLAQTSQTLGFEIDRRPDDGQVAPALVEVVIVGMNALCFCHTSMFGSQASAAQSGSCPILEYRRP